MLQLFRKQFLFITAFSKAAEGFIAKRLFFKACRVQCILKMKIQHQIFNHLIIRVIKHFFDNERSDDYIDLCIWSGCLVTVKNGKSFSSIAGKISSAKTFAHDFSKAFCSLAVRPEKLSVMDSC